MKNTITLLCLFLSPLLLSAQLQNLDFENWELPVTATPSPNNPTHWKCGLTFGENESFSDYFQNQTYIDAQNNNYALRLSIWYYYVKDAAIQRASINYLPEKLKGYYKYAENMIEENGNSVVDTALVKVFLTKWNTIAAERDTIGRGELKIAEEQLNYELFEVNINYMNTQTPDSIAVILDPSLVKRETNSNYVSSWEGDGYASFFTIDNLSLEGSVLSNNSYEKPQITLYPNPASEEIFISGYIGDIIIYSITGEKIVSKTIKKNQPVYVGNLSKGVYFIKLVGEKRIVRKFIKK